MSDTANAPARPHLAELAARNPTPLAMPIAVFPGLSLTGGTVREAVTRAEVQVAASVALHERYQTPFALSAMDLSVEAEAFGCKIMMSDDEVPTVTGSLITTPDGARALRQPQPGEGRTPVYLETVRQLAALPDQPLVLAGCIGPFSLAARLTGVSEAMMLTMTEPELMHLLCEKSAQFLAGYIKAFQQAGAGGVIMAEPAAGLLSPGSLARFSSRYVRQIIADTHQPGFSLVLHNCAARLLHLSAVLESGAGLFHFGAPMDLPAALRQAPADVTLCGNLDPTAVFVQSTPDQVAALTAQRLTEAGAGGRFIVSSGCDVPARAPLANLDAFFRAAANHPPVA
jgi:uroporphyrinogen decarboxylase